MKKFFFDCGTRDATASFAFLVLRVCTGLMMLFGHGVPKIKNYGVLKDLFYVPTFLPREWSPACLIACIGAEVVCAAFIVLGFATRTSAFIIGFCMVVAAFGYLVAAPWFLTGPTLIETKEISLMYLIPMLVLILAGAGSYSLDAAIYKEGKRRRW